MLSRAFLRPSCRLLAVGFATFLSLLVPTLSSASVPGGILESDETTVVRGIPTPTQIAAFMPSRGLFTFPAPYNTQGIRITNDTDCGGQDCVDMIYSYWRNMSNSTGSNTLYIFVGLDRNRGGQGPTLFSYDKTTDQLTEVGPMFSSSSSYSWYSGEGWYFSYGMPTKIYMPIGSQLQRYDVLAHTFETVFDSTTQFPNTVIRQANSSNDDDVHSATLQQAGTYATLGCVAYKVSTKQFFYFAAQGKFDECQIDKSGRYLEIKELLPSDPCTTCDEDDVIEDLQAGTQQVLLDQNGAGGHSDLGYGTMVAVDNWNNYANAWREWDLATALVNGGPTSVAGVPQGGLVYHGTTWSVFAPSHSSFENAVPASVTPLSQQYACGDADNATIAPHANEILCYLLDPTVPASSEQVLVVAPVMTDPNATGGNATCPNGCTSYAKDPKGNIDPTGQYFFWTSNLGGSRLDAFVVKIPYQVLTGSSAPAPTPPTVNITSPASGSTVSGSVAVSASATDSSGITSVQFQLDGTNLGSPVTASPYSISWDTTSVAAGSHSLTAIAVDNLGLSATSSSVAVTVATVTPAAPPSVSITAPTTGTTVSGTVTVSADATDGVGISAVQFQLNGTNLGSPVSTSPYSISWNTSAIAAGNYSLTAIATDTAGRSTASHSVSVTIDAVSSTPPPPTPGPTTVPTTGNIVPTAKGGGGMGLLSLLLLMLGLHRRRASTMR